MKMKNYLVILCTFISSVVFPQTGTTTSGSFTSGGVTRKYTYYVPAMYDGTTAVPLVFNLHGLSGTSAKQESYEDFRTIADTANFIVVHAEGLNQSPIGGFTLLGWGSMTTVSAAAADEAFVMSLLDTMEAHYNINANKVYSTGYSQGAFMSYNLGCRYSSRFAAVASSCGSLSNANLAACTPVHPLPIMEIHGTADNTIPYAGSSSYLHTDSLVKHWVQFNHCNPVPTTVENLADISDSATVDMSKVIHYVYTGGDNGSTVELYKVINGGHQVPSDVATANSYGVGNRNMDFKASKEIWRFFSQYSKNLLTGISEKNKENNSVAVYPNPSNGIFTVEIKYMNNADLTVYNMLGEEVLTEKLSNRLTTVNLGNAPAGVYFYHVSSAIGIIASGKLIVE